MSIQLNGEEWPLPVSRKGLPFGNITYTEPYRKGLGTAKFFANGTYGADMNQNAGFSGTPIGVHNGTDTVEWTGSNLVGTHFVFNSTTQHHSGTKSVDGTVTVNGDTALFASGSSYTTDVSFVAITGWIYITGWSTASGTRDIQLQFRLSGVNVGAAVNLSPYIVNQMFNTWQKFSIPITDFILLTTSINELTVQTIGSSSNVNTAPHYYLDDIQLEQTGGSIPFSVVPDANSFFHVLGIGFFLADTLDSRLASSSMPNITWNKLLGLNQLSIGILSTSSIGGVFTFTGLFKNHGDFMVYPNAKFQAGGDGTTTWVKYDVSFDNAAGTPLILDSRAGDSLSFIVNDDLTGLDRFRILVNGITEPIVAGENDL